MMFDPHTSMGESVTDPVCERAQTHMASTGGSTPEEFAEAVRRALHALNDDRLLPITVRILDGEVRLCGRLRTYYAKQLALHAAVSVAGGERVRDELIVESTRTAASKNAVGTTSREEMEKPAASERTEVVNQQQTKTAATTIKAEHASLNREVTDWRQWWEELSELGKPHFGEMGGRLAQFREHLVAHIAHEESLLSDSSSGDVYELSRLRDEHAGLLSELDRLIERLRACEPDFDCWGNARSAFESFLDRLHTHEAVEEALFDRLP